MPTKNTGDMVVRAMRWALAHGHTAEEAYDLATYMTGNELPEKEAEKKEKTDTFYCRSISDTHFAGSILCNE